MPSTTKLTWLTLTERLWEKPLQLMKNTNCVYSGPKHRTIFEKRLYHFTQAFHNVVYTQNLANSVMFIVTPISGRKRGLTKLFNELAKSSDFGKAALAGKKR